MLSSTYSVDDSLPPTPKTPPTQLITKLSSINTLTKLNFIKHTDIYKIIRNTKMYNAHCFYYLNGNFCCFSNARGLNRSYLALYFIYKQSTFAFYYYYFFRF